MRRAALVVVMLGCAVAADESPAAPRAAAADAEPVVTPEPAPVAASAPADPDPEPSRAPLRLALVGDVIFGHYTIHGWTAIAGEDAFADVRPLLAADVGLANLETPLARTLPPRSPLVKGHRFGAPPEVAGWLAAAGFHAVSLANNHVLDLGAPGLRESAGLLEAGGVQAIGRPDATDDRFAAVTLEVSGWRVAIVGATIWLNARVPEDAPRPPLARTRRLADVLGPAIRQSARDHDIVVAALHWGRQFEDHPTAEQRAAARELVDAGADLVWGHHPHVLQGIEWIDGAVVAYSLGNFLFFGMKEDPDTRDTAVLGLVRDPSGAWSEATLAPVRIEGHAHPRPIPAVGDDADRIGRRIASASRRLGSTTSVAEDGRVVVTP